MTILVIKFKELFPPNQDAFSENERDFYSEWANIQKNLSVVTHVLCFGRIHGDFT